MDAIVIDADGYKVEYVLAHVVNDGSGDGDDGQLVPESYTMQDGESLVTKDVGIALSMNQPWWNGEEWEEMKAPEIMASLPPPIDYGPTLEERLNAVEAAILEMAGDFYG